MSDAYYSENDPVACAVLREAIQDKIIAPGYVDSRSIKDVRVEDLYGFEQHHFFAGAGLWSVACRLAGWPDDRSIWTASCPCQGWSVAGKGLGFDDPRDLWPDLFRLWRAYRPAVGVGEITSGSAILPWLDRTCADLEGEDYACRAVSIPACAVDAPNIRQRLWWSALDMGNGKRASGWRDCRRNGRTQEKIDSTRQSAWCVGNRTGNSNAASAMAHPDSRGRDGRQEDAQRRSIGRDATERADDFFYEHWQDIKNNRDLVYSESHGWEQRWPEHELRSGRHATSYANGSFWSDAEWIACADGKARRAKPGLRMLVDGMAGRTDLWRLCGNSINPILAAEVIKALKDQIDARH